MQSIRDPAELTLRGCNHREPNQYAQTSCCLNDELSGVSSSISNRIEVAPAPLRTHRNNARRLSQRAGEQAGLVERPI